MRGRALTAPQQHGRGSRGGGRAGPGRLGIREDEVRSVGRVPGDPLGRGRAGHGGRQDAAGRYGPFGREPAVQERLRDPAERGLPRTGRRGGRGRPGALRHSRLPPGIAQPRQLVDDLVEPLALDELHRVVGHLAVAADLVDRHDVGVVQPRRRLRLAAEPFQGQAVFRNLAGQDLERHLAAQADLLGLVDHPHAAPADLAEDAVIAQPPLLARGWGRRGLRAVRPGVAVDRQVLLDHHQGRQQLADLVGQLGVAGGQVLDARPLAGPEPRQERLGDDLEGVAIDGRVAHGHSSEIAPGKAARISLSRSSARV